MDQDSTPSTSGLSSPPKRRKLLSLGDLSMTEKQSLINLYKQFLSDEPEIKITAIVSKIITAMGVSKSTVYRTIKEYKNSGKVMESKHCGGRPGIVEGFEEYVKNSIRRIVHSFFYKNEIPTLNKIMIEIRQHPEIPNMSRSSLHKLMKEINFKYMKRSCNSILMERDDIVRWRRNYLRSIKQYRQENRPIYYLDETWLNEGHTKTKIWVDKNIKNKTQAFSEGLTTGLKNPSGKGKRLIILHAGSEQGFVQDALLVFESKKTGDYHEDMNAVVFEEWFSNVLKKIPDRAVIVMDNAPYHSRKLEKVPTTCTLKKDMQKWLQSKNIKFDPGMVRSELMYIINQHKEKYHLFATNEMAKQNNKVVLRLPPYHCELNPIEIWAQVKNEVAAKNNSFKLKHVKFLLIEALDKVTNINWQNCVAHIIKEEEKMDTLDGIMDNLIEPIIISLSRDSDSEIDSDIE